VIERDRRLGIQLVEDLTDPVRLLLPFHVGTLRRRVRRCTMTIDADLTGKTAIVTGASSGIGRAIAERMGAAGAHVILSGRTADAMADSAARITDAGGRATVLVGDVREPSAIDELVATALAADGHLDILVNNAGV